MNIVLCHPHDKDAIWLYSALKNQDVEIELLSPEQLLMAKEWNQTITSNADSYKITTKSGITLHSEDSHFFVNRSQLAQTPLWSKAEEPEKQYVSAEMNAMFLSWLYQVEENGKLLNPSIGYSLSGAFYTDEQWENFAYKSGFKNVRIKNENLFKHELNMVLVVEDELINNSLATEDLLECCLLLSKQTGIPLLEMCFTKENILAGVNCFPSFKKYGKNLVEIISKKMKQYGN